MISPGSSRAMSAARPARSHSAMRNSPVEMSIQASAKRFSSPTEARAGDGKQVVVAPCVEQRVLCERAGRDHADDVAPHHALAAALLRLGRVLELLAHRDAMAERDQAVEIFVGAMDRHAAHGDVAAEMLAALGEHDAE